MSFLDTTIQDFSDKLASRASVPGGGGASALVGAAGVALGAMVGELTVGKKKYAAVEADIKALMVKANEVRAELLHQIDEDARVFEPLSKAYGLPKDTEEQRQEKAVIMENCLKEACSVPMAIMEKCCEAILLQKDFAAKGSSLAISDAGVGVAFCRAALEGAALNVFINTKSMTDTAYAEGLNKKANEMLAVYVPMADEIYKSVFDRLVKK